MAAVVFVAAVASACSSMPDWANPDTWGGSDDQTATTSGDQTTTDQTGTEGKTVAEASDQYPTLADTPDKAPPTTSTDEQKQVASGLVADRSQAQYSAEALRGGTEAAAAPPEAAAPDAPVGAAAGTPAAAGDQPGTDTNSNPDAAPASSPAAVTADKGARSPMPGTLPSETPGAAAPPAARASTTAAVSSAPMPPPPAAPAIGTSAPPAPQIASTDAALGFQPSHAPPLDPQGAQLSGQAPRGRHRELAALNAAAPAAQMYSAASGTPAAVVTFPKDTIVLGDDARAQVHTAVAAFRAAGGQGYVRVVGHAAGGSTDQVRAVERSQALATAVARELIKEGVPPKQVLVDAVADEGGERRAEIFLQG